DPYVKKAIAEGREIAFTTSAGARYFLKHVTTDDLLKMKPSRGVWREFLVRKGVREEHRKEALTGLAKLEKKSEIRILLDAIQSHDQSPARARGDTSESVLFDLARLLTSRPPAELADVRGDLVKMGTNGNSAVARQLGFVALIATDGSIDGTWALGAKSVTALRDLVNAMTLIRDPAHRASLYPKVEPLLSGLPKELITRARNGKPVPGRYVRIELPGERRTLTLAEVEVYSSGRNIARQGKATQKNTAHGGDASKAIDGNKSGHYSDGGQTHTEENTKDPWWEVDLGAEHPIDSIVIYNRTEGYLSGRLNGFTLKVLDRGRNVVFEKRNLPAPNVKAAYEVSGDAPERLLRHAAMNALTSVRGKEADAFKAIARFVRSDTDRQ